MNQQRNRAEISTERLSSENNRMLYGGLGPAVAASVVIALMLLLVQWQEVDWRFALTWAVLYTLVACARLLGLAAYRRNTAVSAEPAFETSFANRTAAAGAVWGLASIWLFPPDPAHQVFLAFVVAGVSAGGVTTLAPSPRAATLFLTLSLLPLSIRLLIAGGLMSQAMAVMTFLFLLFLVLSARRLAGTIHENSRLRFHEEGLRDTERTQSELLRRMGEIGRIGIWEFELATGRMRWSDELYSIYGLEHDAGLDIDAALASFAEPGRSEISSGVEHVVATGIPYEGEHEFISGDGDTLWMRIVVEPVITDGVTTRLHGITQDITERRRIDALKSEFVSTVSHELRTPLTSIRGSLGLVASGAAGELPDRARRLLDIAARNSERLILLINDILDIEKIESGKMDFSMRRQPIMPLVEQSIESTSAYASELGVSYVLHGHVDALADVDGERIVQVIVNLLSNAAKFSPRGAAVSVSVSQHEDEVRIEVSDTGPGIPADFLPRLFDKFSQADSSDQRLKGGTGLGLAISSAIMSRLHGRISVQTEVGAGSTFTVHVPVAARMAAVADQPDDGRPGHVLLIDMATQTARRVHECLTTAAYRVTQTSQPATVAEHIARDPSITTCILCIRTGDGQTHWMRDWFETQQDVGSIRVVAVTTTDDAPHSDDIRIGRDMPVRHWLTKPADMSVLRTTIRETFIADDRRPRILHVEEDEDLSRTVVEVLSDFADVHTAASCKEGRAALAEPFDGLLLDIELPDGSGWQVVEHMAPAGAVMPVIVFSADGAAPADAAAAMDALLPTHTSLTLLPDIIR